MRPHRYPCPAPTPRSAFAGYRFLPEVIALAVRWYLRFGLSYRDVEELLAERGVKVDHVTVYRWVERVRTGVRRGRMSSAARGRPSLACR
jgi:IS6 family transposase